jgi:hypothetical protein
MRPRSTRRVRVALLVALALCLAIAAPVAAAKPGYPTRISWGGQSWQVKTSQSAVGPGPNVFAASNVSVDASGRLHLAITRDAAGRWTTAEVIGPTSHGYGTYAFTLASDVSALDPNVVLGLFTWSDRAQQAHREIDVEFARWGVAGGSTNAQYVVQPADRAGHLARFAQPSVSRTVHRFTWSPGRVAFESRRLDTGALMASYTYAGSDVPKPGDEKVRLNLWLFNGAAPTNGAPVEVIVESFGFTGA